MSQQLIEEELIDPLPDLMPRWTALMRYATENNIIVLEKGHAFTSNERLLEDKFKVSYNNNDDKMCLVTEAFGGFNDRGRVPYDTRCCGLFPYEKASEALRSWENFIEYKKELYNHIIDKHPEVKI